MSVIAPEYRLNNLNPILLDDRCRRVLDVDLPHLFFGFCHVITVFPWSRFRQASSGSGNAVVQALAIAWYKVAVGCCFLLLTTLSRIPFL
jgi:hypothetical protein